MSRTYPIEFIPFLWLTVRWLLNTRANAHTCDVWLHTMASHPPVAETRIIVNANEWMFVSERRLNDEREMRIDFSWFERNCRNSLHTDFCRINFRSSNILRENLIFCWFVDESQIVVLRVLVLPAWCDGKAVNTRLKSREMMNSDACESVERKKWPPLCQLGFRFCVFAI